MKAVLTSSEMPRRLTEQSGGVWRRLHVIDCQDCDRQDRWLDHSYGWTKPQRVLDHFRKRGWAIGKDRTRDLCPNCLAAQAAAPRPKPKPAAARMPPPAPITLEEIMTTHAAPAPAPDFIAQLEGPARRRTGYKRQVSAHTPIWRPGRHKSPHMTRGFAQREVARITAKSYLKACGVADPAPGRHYNLWPTNAGWAWAPTDPTLSPPPEVRAVPFPPEHLIPDDGRRRPEGWVYPPRLPGQRRADAVKCEGIAYGPGALHAARKYIEACGGVPHEGHNFRRFNSDDGRWGWELIEAVPQRQPQPQEPPVSMRPVQPEPDTANDRPALLPYAQATATAIHPIATAATDVSFEGLRHVLLSGEPLPPVDTALTPWLSAEPPRPATPMAKRAIREFLDTQYDDDAGRWRAAMSDAAAAKQLDLPRAWVTDVREAGGYGPDRNETDVARAKARSELAEEAHAASEQASALVAKFADLEKRIAAWEAGA